MKNKIELMAPAGSFEALKAAVNAGADAVYLGGSRFGARQFAENFDREELKKALQFAHLRGVKIYVTVNTLLTDSELREAEDYLQFLYNAGADAIIVQDLGVFNLARQLVPELPLFASTQLTVTDSQSVRFAERLGFARVVLPREASLADMQEICRQAKCEIEVFVHGALCMSFSGQCLMSSLIGGRSGNRGQCAQPCRLPYALTNQQGRELLTQEEMGKYLLSPKDLKLVNHLRELIKAGVYSFKIEGRMKRPEYVAVVTSVYRKALDSILLAQEEISAKDERDLKQIFNRDFTEGYLWEKPGRKILSDKRPNNRGVQIGRIAKVDREKGFLEIKLEEDISLGDQFDIWVRVGGRAACTVEKLAVNNQPVTKAKRGEIAQIPFQGSVSINDRVFRTFDAELTAFARGFFAEKSQSNLPLWAQVKAQIGQPLELSLTDQAGNVGQAKTDFIVEEARKHALSRETLQKQLERLGETDFYLADLKTDLAENIMVPVSELNKVRREALARLVAAALAKNGQGQNNGQKEIIFPTLPLKRKITKSLLAIHVDTLPKLKAALAGGADLLIYGGESYDHHFIGKEEYAEALRLAAAKGKKVYFATPRIVMQAEQNDFLQLLSALIELKPAGIVASSLAAYESASKYKLPVWLDYSLNTFNSLALAFWRQAGVEGVTLSQELNLQQVESLLGILPVECLVQGRPEMMITQYCAIGGLLGKQGQPCQTQACRQENYYFKDRLGELFPLVTDQFCRLHVLNAKELSLLDQLGRFSDLGIERLRIDGRSYPAQQLQELVKSYRHALDSGHYPEKTGNITRGHYFRGVN